MKKLDLFWMTNKEWWDFDENMNYVLTDKAPEEAVESFKHYRSQIASSKSL